MIREFLIGSALVGGGGYYVASSYMSADIFRTVNATPQDSWRAFDAVLNQQRDELGDFGMSTPADPHLSWPVVTSVPGKEIDYVVKRDNIEAIHIKLRFDPLDGGRKTQLSIDADVNTAALPEGAHVTAAHAALFRIAIGKVADEFIAQVESGKMVQLASAFTEMRRQMRANPGFGEARMRMEEHDRREAQEAASRPQLDPNEGKMNPVGAEVRPMNPNPGY